MILSKKIKTGDQVQLFTDSGPDLQFTLAGKVGDMDDFTIELLPLDENDIKFFPEDKQDQIAAVAVMFPTDIPINTIVLTSRLRQDAS